MSVVNLHVNHDKVWLVTDTLAFVRGKPFSLVSKFTTFPHLYALVAFRGLLLLHRAVDKFVNGHVVDIEDAAARLPDHLRAWQAGIREDMPDRAERVRGVMWLVGWRPSTKSFGGWMLSSDADFELDELPVPMTVVAPGCEDVGWFPPAVIDSPERLIRCVEAQKEAEAAALEAGEPALGIGGEIILCQLTKEGFSIRKAHRFEDYNATKELVKERQLEPV